MVLKYSRLCISSTFILLLSVCTVLGSTVVHDDFDDGVLDPAWSLDFIETNAWTYQETGSAITVSDIVDFVVNDDWARVRLVRPVDPLADFTVDFDFAWDSEGSGDAMQNVFVRMLDVLGAPVVVAGAWDAWRLSPGSKYGQIGAVSTPSVPGSIPLSGEAEVDIVRQGAEVEITWNGVPLMADTTRAVVHTLEIEFSYFHQSGGTTSFFGNESVDLIRVEGSGPTAIPLTRPVVLHAPWPNPFNPQAAIAFDLPASTVVQLRVFDAAGRLVRVLVGGEARGRGRHEVRWNGRDDEGRPVAAGVYFYRLDAGAYTDTRRSALVK